MPKVFLRVLEPVDKNSDLETLTKHLPEIRKICSNKIRAGILHLLVNSPETLHSMQVEQLSFKLGIRPTVCIHHLEKLEKWKLVEVKKRQNYGNKERRTIWGLNLRYPSWVLECYKNIRTFFFSEKELKEITSRNKSFRKLS